MLYADFDGPMVSDAWRIYQDVGAAIAAAAGFLIGGGLKNRLGLAILGIVGRVAIQGAATTFMAALAAGNHHNETPNGASRDSNGYDKPRGNVQESG